MREKKGKVFNIYSLLILISIIIIGGSTYILLERSGVDIKKVFSFNHENEIINQPSTSAITKEKLKEALNGIASLNLSESNIEFTVSDDIITIVVDGKSYILNYDLNGKPTFSSEISIEKGMTYANFGEQIADQVALPMIGYMAIANIQGANYEDASSHFLMSYLENALNGFSTSENSYVIASDGVTVNNGETKTIYISEFGERVMEYVNAIYKNKQIINDSAEGINSYELTIERKDITDTSCKLVASLSVNLDADFSKLNENSNQVDDSFLNKFFNKDTVEENVDYQITLKVGQKCRIETTEKITGYTAYGTGYEYDKISENCVEITGKSVGKENRGININIGETEKLILINVEENDESKTLDTITLKLK